VGGGGLVFFCLFGCVLCFCVLGFCLFGFFFFGGVLLWWVLVGFVVLCVFGFLFCWFGEVGGGDGCGCDLFVVFFFGVLVFSLGGGLWGWWFFLCGGCLKETLGINGREVGPREKRGHS